MWIKIRERWSHGYGEWEYRETDMTFEQAVEDYQERYDHRNYYSEHWRGLDIKIASLAEVPEEKFTNQINRLVEERNTWEERFYKAVARYTEWKQAKVGISSSEQG